MTVIKKILLSLTPIAFIAINLGYLSVIFPLYSGPQGYDQDPAYAYLFNGLLILDGQAPWHVDHPGTPLQFLCAGIVLLLNAFSLILPSAKESNVIDHVLINAEIYLYAISCVLVTLNAGVLYYFGYRINQATSKLWIAIFCQISGISFAVLTPRAGYVAPEALLFFASYSLLGLLAPLIFKEEDLMQEIKKNPSRLIGIVCGFGLAVKVTFFPMLGLIFLIRSNEKKIKIFAYAIITFLIILIPISESLDRMFGWFWSIVSHSGIHGSGLTQMMDWSQLTNNLKSVMTWYAPLYVVMVFLFIYLVVNLLMFHKKNIKTRSKHVRTEIETMLFQNIGALYESSLRVPVVFIAIVATQTALVLKHPGAHYMIPVLPLAFVGFAWLLNSVDKQIHSSTRFFKDNYRYGITCFAAIFALYGIYPTIKQLYIMKDQRVEQNSALIKINTEIEKYPNALTICAFRCTTFQYAVSMGLLYSPGLSVRNIVKSLLNNFYEYNFYVKEMIAPGVGSFSLSEIPDQIKKHEKLFLITPKNYPELDVFTLQLIVSAGPLMLYEITGLSDEFQSKQSHDQTN